ncbi:GGDEF domain-containing protein [Colwellia sp. BRX10-3]|uniref:tetratricopeptide repeat-containing diguanylate cyclase n=1 Tax=Colwellia sp. BRX10-3 TaxID=2759844 RepID=UPI0015F74DA7|nr:GGDEF domain-containing protein [Colwellia sp. BRX10-3]MBA6391908.1 GGDEF domain-containing protein [Colwellia sp. BRX10-3]
MILTSRNSLLNVTTFIWFILAAFLVTKAFAQEPIEHYAELKKVQYVNTEQNRLFVNNLLSEVNTQNYLAFQAPIYAYIAKLKTRDGNWLEGKYYLDLAIAKLPLVNNDDLFIDSLESISGIFLIRGDYSETIIYVQKMADFANKTKNQRGETVALNRLALSYIQLELFQLAIEPLKLALALARETKDYDSEFLATLYLISVRSNLPQFNRQETLALTLVAEKIPSKYNNNNGYLSRLKGEVHQQIGDFSAAKKWFELAQTKAKSDHDVRLLQIVSKDLAELYLATDKPLLALDYAINSLEFNNQTAHANHLAAIHYLLSNIYQQMGDDKNSLKYLRAYADFRLSANEMNTVSVITNMDKRIENIQSQQKFTELKNSLLINKVMAEENKNKQQFSIFIIILLGLAFCFVIIVFFVHHRMLKAQVVSSMKDGLTGIFCRSYLKSYLPAVKSRFERETNNELSLGALIIDCDDFKFINDTFGHAGGDKALKAIVNTISTQIREHDLLLRWGGDEFVLICESISHTQMRELANRITSSISDLLLEYDQTTLSVTISAGYALHNKAENFNFDSLIKAADEYLLATKKSGKNNYLGSKSHGLNVTGFSSNFSNGNA